MKQGMTELVFILDRSGSMSGLESDTIGGFNGLLEKQKQESGECIVTTVLFDGWFDKKSGKTAAPAAATAATPGESAPKA